MRFKLPIVAFGVAAVVAGGVVYAQDAPKATGVVALRQATMKANGDHMAAIKVILTETPELMALVPAHAEAIHGDAESTSKLFPPGSDQPASWALPAVWSDQAGFEAAATKATELSGKLVEAAKGGDPQATLAAFATLGKEGCGGCHQTFRKKDS